MISMTTIAFFLIFIVIAFFSYLFGSKKGASKEKIKNDNELLNRNKVFQFQKENYQKEIDMLHQQVQRYLNFFINIPEVVKNINSQLSLDDLIPSIIRLVKVLIKTEEIEIYMFDQYERSLKLIAALGTNRGRSIKVKFGEGVVGGAAMTRMLFTKDQMRINLQGNKLEDEKLEIATPIIFKKEIFGVIGIGKIRSKTDHDKMFLSLIADLSAIAFKNCEHMDSAKEEAIKDALTGLHNRRYFFDRGQEILEKSLNYNQAFSIFILDIDNFKHYNDTNGHVQGDNFLKELGKLLKENTRSTNIASRYGGEEFIILYQNSDKSDAIRMAEGIRKLIESHPFPNREKQPLGFVSISGGIATFPHDGKSIMELIEHADRALYESKHLGKNCITPYNPAQFSPSEVIK